MSQQKNPTGIARLSTWISSDHWAERIICFNASWFVASMGTGVIVQVLNNFPYGARWLRGLAYCFWVLDIVLFVFFSTLGIIRSIRYPHLTKSIFQDFYQTSFLGAIPVTVDTISVGILIFYSDQMTGVWIAYGLYWAAMTMSLIVGGIIVFTTCAYQDPPELSDVTGVWLLSFIPCVVTAATGSLIIPHLPLAYRGSTMVATFLIWSLGVTMSLVIISYYFWRLIRIKLPVRDAIVSCFIPMGPPGLGAYGIQNLSLDLSAYIIDRDAALLPAPPHGPPAISPSTATLAVAASIHWLGILAALLLISLSTFWLLQSTLAVAARVPKRFNVGFWSFVFPNAVYANALCLLAKDLDSHALRGCAATMCAVTVMLWCLCAAGTLWKGVWCGELFFAPGLEGWSERRALGLGDADDAPRCRPGGAKARRARSAGSGSGESEAQGARFFAATQRTSRPDGTYTISRSEQWRRSRGRPVEEV